MEAKKAAAAAGPCNKAAAGRRSALGKLDANQLANSQQAQAAAKAQPTATMQLSSPVRNYSDETDYF